jgi:hypothetical protein
VLSQRVKGVLFGSDISDQRVDVGDQRVHRRIVELPMLGIDQVGQQLPAGSPTTRVLIRAALDSGKSKE